MKSVFSIWMTGVTVACLLAANVCVAQNTGAAADPMGLLKKDVGSWKCTIKFWMDPNADPETSEGEETNRMMGDLWLISEFRGNFFGSDFEGHGTFGYDAEKQKYVGTWIDTMSPYPMAMEGTWDEASQTLTHLTNGKGPDGAPTKGKTVTKYNRDGTHVMTMYMDVGGEMIRTMEITYSKK